MQQLVNSVKYDIIKGYQVFNPNLQLLLENYKKGFKYSQHQEFNRHFDFENDPKFLPLQHYMKDPLTYLYHEEEDCNRNDVRHFVLDDLSCHKANINPFKFNLFNINWKQYHLHGDPDRQLWALTTMLDMLSWLVESDYIDELIFVDAEGYYTLADGPDSEFSVKIARIVKMAIQPIDTRRPIYILEEGGSLSRKIGSDIWIFNRFEAEDTEDEMPPSPTNWKLPKRRVIVPTMKQLTKAAKDNTKITQFFGKFILT